MVLLQAVREYAIELVAPTVPCKLHIYSIIFDIELYIPRVNSMLYVWPELHFLFTELMRRTNPV